MKRWCFYLLLVCWGAACLLLILDHQSSGNHNPQGGGDRSVDSSRESVSISSRALLATSTRSVQTRAGPDESLASHCAQKTNDVEPPWLDTRGPPGTCREPWVRCQDCQPTWQLRAAGRSALVSQNFGALRQKSEKRGFATAFS